jgi:hypothetical protein
MRKLGLGVCTWRRTRPRRHCSAAGTFSATRALRTHHDCGQRARAGVLPPGSSAEHTAQGARAPRAHGQQTAPAVQRTHRGCGAPWQCARARAPRHRRRLGHPHDASRPAAGACAHSGRGQAPSKARVRGRASARLARGRGAARTTEHWARVRTCRCHARMPRVAGSEGPAEAQAGQWSKPRTAREGEKLYGRTISSSPRSLSERLLTKDFGKDFQSL